MNIEMLKKNFNEILSYEERAKNFYDHYIDYVDDQEIKKQFEAIRNDEIIHLKIVHRLLDLAS